FSKIDLKVGTIISAEKIEKADKLLKLEIDLGFERRTIVSGIALHFKPEEIAGKQVVVVANLAPRKMRGIESNGMILMAEDEEGKGLLNHLGKEGIHVSMSTILPQTAAELTRLHQKGEQHYLASPVFGRPEAAAEKKLNFTISGEEEIRKQVAPLLKDAGGLN